METEMLLEKNLLTFMNKLKEANPEIEPIINECCRPCGENTKRVSLHDWLTQVRELSADKLRQLGLQTWTAKHWLYPTEWFEHLPAGLDVLDIFGTWSKFDAELHSPDSRFGMLPYGFGEFEVEKG